MSIRSKQLLLRLCAALLPVALSAWHSVRQIDSITGHVAEATWKPPSEARKRSR